MALYVLGGSGRLGRAIASEYAGSELFILERSIYENWSRDGAVDLVSKYFDKNLKEKSTVFVASGLLDPKALEEDLFRVNYTLPKNIIDSAAEFDVDIITFGTVLEGLIKSKNPYVKSKTELSKYIEMAVEGRGSIKHIQLHTLYGIGLPSEAMFLGQMLFAVENNIPFQMTSGRQLREYHHLEDEAAAIRTITDSPVFGVINLSHGKPVSLKSIAESVFESLGKSHLLQLGALEEPLEENYHRIFQISEVIKEINFRDTLPAVCEYIRKCCSR